MQQAQTPLGGICVHARKPTLHAAVVGDVAARLLKRLAPQREPLALRLLNHAGHVGQHGIGVLRLGQSVGLGPKLLVALAHGGNEVVFLHVARGQRAVEIVDQRYCEFLLHHSLGFIRAAARPRRVCRFANVRIYNGITYISRAECSGVRADFDDCAPPSRNRLRPPHMQANQAVNPQRRLRVAITVLNY